MKQKERVCLFFNATAGSEKKNLDPNFETEFFFLDTKCVLFFCSEMDGG